MAETTEKRGHKDEIRAQMKGTLSELKTLRDEIRVKIHLAGMEARDAWTKLEPRVHDFEDRVEKAAGVTASELKEAAADLKRHLKRIRDEVAHT